MSRQNDDFSTRYDEAVFDLAVGKADECIEQLRAILEEAPDYFEAQSALGMAWFRKGDYARALEEGLKAMALNPEDQMVHTNLSMCYVRLGDKKKAEEHALRAKLIYWKKVGKEPPPFLKQTVEKDLQILSQAPPPQSVVFMRRKDQPAPEN